MNWSQGKKLVTMTVKSMHMMNISYKYKCV